MIIVSINYSITDQQYSLFKSNNSKEMIETVTKLYKKTIQVEQHGTNLDDLIAFFKKWKIDLNFIDTNPDLKIHI